MKDKIIKCENCKQEFVFTKNEQEFYDKKGLKEPKYCLICRGMLREASKDSFRKL